MNVKYMKVSLFEISYKKKIYFWDVPVHPIDIHIGI